MSFYAINPDLARLLLAHQEHPAAVEVARPLTDAGPDQRPVAMLVLAFGVLSVLSAVLP